MLGVSKHTLKILAALVWYTGGIVLLLKGGRLLLEAKALKPEQNWIYFAPIAALCIGGLKAKFLFHKVCQKNLARIDALDRPQLWEFFRLGFFVFLAAMILLGMTLSRLAHGSYPFLLGVATLDLSIATALLASSVAFWRRGVLER